MSAPYPRFRLAERITLPAPLGLIFWDFATNSAVADGLTVSIAPNGKPTSALPLIVNRSGVWLAPALPGRSAHDLATGDWSVLRRPYRIEVMDSFGRFLPMAIEAELPASGLYHWPGWDSLPPEPLAPLGNDESPPQISPKRIPLFSAPSRASPPAIAEVRCQLAEAEDSKAASWALVTVSHAGLTRGIGLADREGRAVIHFGYPERPRPSLATSPPAITDFRWELEVAAFYDPPSGEAAEVPLLSDLFAQLDHARDPLDSILSPPEVLPPQLLTFGRPLTLRTSQTPEGQSSTLFLAPE